MYCRWIPINSEVVIDGRIRIKALGSSGSKIRVGITAPPHVPIEAVDAEIHKLADYMPKRKVS